MFTCTGTNGFNSVSMEIQVMVASAAVGTIIYSGLSIGLILLLCLIILIMIFLYKRSKRRKKVDIAVTANGTDPGETEGRLGNAVTAHY